MGAHLDRSHAKHHRFGLMCSGVRLQFVPFIQGPRNCLGQYFALLEARIVLALLVKVSQPHSHDTCHALTDLKMPALPLHGACMTKRAAGEWGWYSKKAVLIWLLFCVQRFKFEYAASTPATRHPSVIPVGPADGMMMNVS